MDVCDITLDACLHIAQPWTLSDDRRNAALERSGTRMSESMEHRRDERAPFLLHSPKHALLLVIKGRSPSYPLREDMKWRLRW